MNRFFISDTHFGHANIIRYCDRPFKDVNHMNEMLIERWNSVVGDDDIVYHLGDVALGPWTEWDSLLTRLNGYIILVIGNHDRVFQGEKPRMQERFAPLYSKWFMGGTWNSIQDLPLANGTNVNLSHFPYDGDSHGEERYKEYRLRDEGTILVHGHTHLDSVMSRSKSGTVQIHVGADAHDFTPVSEQQVIDYIRVAEDVL